MRNYSNEKLEKAFCNKCGREIKVENGTIMEGNIDVNVKWGYFSEKDLEQHSFDLCEQCYDSIVAEFNIPVEVTEYTELP